jgi:hypothetical protein
MYLALGDPLQKRNYYRAGWLRFKDDADMSVVMAELSEKKVCFRTLPCGFSSLFFHSQIEGFKLHVTHNVRPFISRIRYTPEVAAKPERMAKDLVNAKKLASILEDEAALLRNFSIKHVVPEEGKGVKSDDDFDATMVDVDDDPEPKERGSEAIERRIEKVVSELCDQGLVDVHDEKGYEAKKVSETIRPGYYF